MTRYVIDARQIRWNAALLQREMRGVPVIGVVKCDAYGTGLLPVSRILLEEGVSALAVLHFREAEALRGAGGVRVLQMGVDALDPQPRAAFQVTQQRVGLVGQPAVAAEAGVEH